MGDLSPVPYRTPFLDRGGLITRPWQQWFEALLDRAGGAGNVVTVLEISQAITTRISITQQLFVVLSSLLAQVEAVETQGAMRVPLPAAFEEASPGGVAASLAALAALTERVEALEIAQVFAAQAPRDAPDTGWAVSNVVADKVYDANATSTEELADVVGTLIATLEAKFILGA